MKNFKTICKNREKIITFGDIKMKEQKFYQYKIPISIDNLNVDKIAVSKKVSFDKNRFKYFISHKDTKRLDLYSYFFQKRVHIEEILIKYIMKFGKM